MWTRLRLCSRAQHFIKQSHLESPEVQRSCEALGRTSRSNNQTHPSMCVHSRKKRRGSWDAWRARVQSHPSQWVLCPIEAIVWWSPGLTMSHCGRCKREVQVSPFFFSLRSSATLLGTALRTLFLARHRTPQMPWPGLETLKSLSVLCFW